MGSVTSYVRMILVGVLDRRRAHCVLHLVPSERVRFMFSGVMRLEKDFMTENAPSFFPTQYEVPPGFCVTTVAFTEHLKVIAYA